MTQLRCLLLGPPRISVAGHPVDPGNRKAMALLAYLALNPGEHPRARLSSLLWPGGAAESAHHSLRNLLWQLGRTPAAGYLKADHHRVGLRPDADIWVDVEHLQDCLDRCEAVAAPDEGYGACADGLQDALQTWRGGFLHGLRLEDSPELAQWRLRTGAALHDRISSVMSALVAWCRSSRHHQQALDLARRWAEVEPLHEPAHRVLIELLALTGQRDAALRHYATYARRLEDALGARPSRRTTTLYEKLRAG